MVDEKRFVMEITVCEYVMDGSNDVLYIKKEYEMCKGKGHLLEASKRLFKNAQKYIEDKL